MAKKKTQIPKYGTITLKGIQYYRTRITDADGKELSLYAVGKGVCVYTQRLYEGYDKLYHQTPGRDVYGRSDC